MTTHTSEPESPRNQSITPQFPNQNILSIPFILYIPVNSPSVTANSNGGAVAEQDAIALP